MKNKSVVWMTQAAMIAAVYVVLALVFAPFGSEAIQVRIAESLTILPYLTSAAVPGLFVGCLVGNVIIGSTLPDIIFGSLATLIGACFTFLLRKKHPIFAPVPPIVANALIIPFVLRYASGINLPIPLMICTIGIGEILSCGVLGMILLSALQKHGHRLFKH